MQYGLRSIPDGEAGTDATLSVITGFVDDSLKRPYVRQAALNAIKNINPSISSPILQAQSLFEFVKKNVAYVQDPIGVETVQTPENTLILKAGDCDDHAALNAALLMSIGIPVRFRVVGYDREAFEHIFTEFYNGGKWTPFDTTVKNPLGYRPPSFPAEKTYNYKGSAMTVDKLMGTTRIPLKVMNRVVYNSTMRTLKSNWNAGLINIADVIGYIRVIDEGNFPGRGTFAQAPCRSAVVDFINNVEKNSLVSAKPLGSINGLEGLDGFLSSVWGGIKKAVGGVASVVTGAVKAVTGGGGTKVTVTPPTITLPEGLVQTQVSPGAASAAMSTGISDLFSNPVVLVALGVGLYLLVRR